MRRFGKIVVKPNKTNPKYLEASYPTPVEAFDQWPGLSMRQTTTFPLTQDGRDDAAAWLASARKRIEAGVWQPEKIRRKQEREKAMTFAEYVDEWNLHRAKSGDLHEATKRLSERYARILCRTFGDMPISRISHKDIQVYSDSLVGAVTHNERRSRLVYLKQILTAAAKPDVDGHSIIQRSPFDIKIPAFHQSEGSAPATPEELRIIHDAMPEHLRLAITLAIAAGGLRIGEVCGLQLRDIDLEHGLLYVRHSVTQGPDDLGAYRLDETKTPESRRVVPIPAPVCRLIREHIDRFCPNRNPDTMLFHAPRHPERVLNPTTIQRQFRTARKRIDREDVTFHSLRATHATMFMIQGGTLRETMDELGHVDVDVAVRCYQRVVPRHRRDVVERLALEYLPAEEPAGIKAQIAQKEEEIDQLRQTVAKLRRRLDELEGEEEVEATG